MTVISPEEYTTYHQEFHEAFRDETLRNIWWHRDPDDDSLTYSAMADRTEELGLLILAKYWREVASSI